MTRIPEKLYFKIGEVSDITEVKPHVLRYWENEFRIINPRKSNARQRVYTRKDVELILEIKRLLYTEKYTLEGAKKKINELRRAGQLGLFNDDKYQDSLRSIKEELASIRSLLD